MSHHLMGMSKWTPWSTCPHFDSVERSASATTGTAAHERLHRLMLHDPELVLDETNMLDRAVAWAANEIDMVSKQCGSHAVFTEETVEIDKEVGGEELAGIYGTVDAFFIDVTDKGEVIHIFDFKSLGKSGNHTPQLAGYALGVASVAGIRNMNVKCYLHTLFGGSFLHNTIETTLGECKVLGEKIVHTRKHCDAAAKVPCDHCKYCQHASSCQASEDMFDLVKNGGLMKFSAPKRLALIEQIESMIKPIKQKARDEIALTEGKYLEDDGVAYAIRTSNGASSVIAGKVIDLWSAVQLHGVTTEEFINIAKFSKPEMMKLLQSKGIKLKSKDDTLLTAEKIVEPFFECKQVEKLERVK